jgi:branched-chain amino acid transport system ATP-binding protein
MADTPSTEAATAHRATEIILQIEDLTKAFGALTAVAAVDLTLKRGEFRSIIGPNGAGKTTLFDLISGGLSPTAGAIYFNGDAVTGLSAFERVKCGIARSFQITTVFHGLTVYENLRLAVQAMAIDEMTHRELLLADTRNIGAVNATTQTVLHRLGLAQMAETPAGALSYGDRRRLEIGLVLATDPAVVLLDEPTAGIGGEEAQTMMTLLNDILADRTVLLIEHDIDLVMSVSDKVTVLHQGQELTTGTPEQVAGDETVQQAYLGEEYR